MMIQVLEQERYSLRTGILKNPGNLFNKVLKRFLKEFAKFVDEPYLSDYLNYEVDGPKTITLGSKMNDIEEEGPF